MTLSTKTENSKVTCRKCGPVFAAGYFQYWRNKKKKKKKKMGVGVNTKLLNKTTSWVDTVNHIST
jgi:hypothetical protein